ncbi:MAG: hypothetical protein E7399_01515 [Ruminococcaceae bacterium]|nr:hypothetical protein [Oscillospiraceae bacterium]
MRTISKKTASMLLSLCMIFSILPVVSGAESITLPDLISDHMLLQQGEPIKLWGTAPAGETVTITLGSTSKTVSSETTTAKSDGTFHAELPATMAGGPYILTFSTPSSTKIVSDVLIGELWVQCGQSLMATTVNSTGSHKEEILPKTTQNKIRLFINTTKPSEDDKKTAGTTRQTDLKGQWKIADRTTAGTYSAMGYSALVKLHEELDLPIGGICCAVGGTAMSYYQVPPEIYGNTDSDYNYGTYFNIKVAPLTQLNIRGIMWNQGSADRWNSNFASDFKKLIGSWRQEFNDEDMPFIFSTSFPSPMKYWASWRNDYIMEDFSIPRLAQQQVYTEVENTGIAISIDCTPVPGADQDPLHPSIRKPAGERLALSALGLVYGVEDQWSSPLYQSAAASGNTAVITFSHVYDGLKTTDGEAPRCFTAAGADGIFHAATAEITGKNTVKITCPKVSEIKQVSYAIEKHLFPYESSSEDKGDWVIDTYPDVNLVNSANLPAGSFAYEVSKVVEEKQPRQKVTDSLEITAALNDSYTLPNIVTVKDNGIEYTRKVIWSVPTINTKKAGITKLYGLAENTDLLIPATVTVKQVDDKPIQSASVTRDGTTINITVELDTVQANRNLYLMAAFYKEDGTYLNSQIKPITLTSGQTGKISMIASMPNDAAKVKLLVVNQNLRPYLTVTEQNLS